MRVRRPGPGVRARRSSAVTTTAVRTSITVPSCGRARPLPCVPVNALTQQIEETDVTEKLFNRVLDDVALIELSDVGGEVPVKTWQTRAQTSTRR